MGCGSAQKLAFRTDPFGYCMQGGVDYDEDGFAYDMLYSGLCFALGIRF